MTNHKITQDFETQNWIDYYLMTLNILNRTVKKKCMIKNKILTYATKIKKKNHEIYIFYIHD